jgi:hypothetical protein
MVNSRFLFWNEEKFRFGRQILLLKGFILQIGVCWHIWNPSEFDEITMAP